MRLRSVAFAVPGVVGVLYGPLLRRRIMTWGATDAEADARLPGDELLEDADAVATRAITIEAPASAVWPWLAQMGPTPRGGAYTYDWIENLLGLNMHSSDRVLPEFQHPQAGDLIGVGKSQMRTEIVEPGRVLSTRSQDGTWVWTFVLSEHDGQTRLISRNRFRVPTRAGRLAMLPMEPGSLVMERKMLHGIKERSERLASGRPGRSRWGGKRSVPGAEMVSALPRDEDGRMSYGADLYWLPLGAGGHSVRLNGRVYEAVVAAVRRRRRCDLYHSALVVCVPGGRFVIEQTPIPAGRGRDRGVVGEGPVGARWAGRWRIFRYEIRRWRDGVIPDIDEAVESPCRVTDDPVAAQRLLDLVPSVPLAVWGRDEFRAGEMWNSNSLISWLIVSSGLDFAAVPFPVQGRAPGWAAGVDVALRSRQPGYAFMRV